MENDSDEELSELQMRRIRHKEKDANIQLRQRMFCIVASLCWELPDDVIRNITDRMECQICKYKRMTHDKFFPRV